MLYVEFSCHIIRVMLTGVCGNAAVEQGHAVCCCRNGFMCLVWEWGGWFVSGCTGVGGVVGVCVASEWVQVLTEKRWYLPRCCGCGPKESPELWLRFSYNNWIKPTLTFWLLTHHFLSMLHSTNATRNINVPYIHAEA